MSINQSNALGNHILGELYECNKDKINDLEFLKETLIKAVEIAGATLVDTMFHQFSPHGVTGIALIMESHFSIHTWPENNYVAIDLFTCNLDMKSQKAVEYMVEALECKRHEIKEVGRGTNV